jgi:hypothetical protein
MTRRDGNVVATLELSQEPVEVARRPGTRLRQH